MHRGLGYVPQQHAIFSALTVRENLRLGAIRQKDNSDIDEALVLFPKIGQRLNQIAGTLSGGDPPTPNREKGLAMNIDQQTSVPCLTSVRPPALRKRGKLASIPDNDGNAAKITTHLGAGGTMRDCPVSTHFRDILKQARPAFWTEALKISAENARLKKMKTARAKMLTRTVCANGHPLTPETSVIKVVKHRAQKHGTWLARNCLICRAASMKKASYTAEDITRAVEGAQAGLTMSQLTSYRHADTRVIRSNQLGTAMRDDPQLAAFLKPLFTKNRGASHQLYHPRKMIVSRTINRGPTLTGVIAAPSHEIFTAVDLAVPRYIDFEVRKDVMGDMMLAILEGTLTIEDAPKRWREFRRGTQRMFPTKYGPVSLDAPAFRDSNTPLIERVSVGLWS